MGKIIAIIALIVLFSITSAVADIVELDLFDLGCPSVYDPDSLYWTMDFDLGVTFIEISNVYIDWAGEITAGLVEDFENPDDIFIYPIDAGIFASLGVYPFLSITTVMGGETTYPDPQVFDCLSEFRLLGTTRSDLLDGQGSIAIEYNQTSLTGWRDYIEYGSVTLDRAALIVEGVIPEPATILLLGLGLLLLKRRTFYGRFGQI